MRQEKNERRGNDCERKKERLPIDQMREDASFNNCKSHEDEV